ncbi:hypothetical protein MNBD_GAMMA13-1254, partial [hydrothermal vent metagenome]
MKVGILLITHGNIGQILLDSAIEILKVRPLPTRALATTSDSDPEQTLAAAKQALNELDSGAGTLVLTDLYGSTPSNIACKLRQRGQVRVVT